MQSGTAPCCNINAASDQSFEAARFSNLSELPHRGTEYCRYPSGRGNEYAIFNPNARNPLRQRQTARILQNPLDPLRYSAHRVPSRKTRLSRASSPFGVCAWQSTNNLPRISCCTTALTLALSQRARGLTAKRHGASHPVLARPTFGRCLVSGRGEWSERHGASHPVLA
jgi:hypothetical protein